MARSATERYAVAAFAFMAAATWLGVGLIHGLLCLLVAGLAAQAVRIYQRRSDSRERAVAQRRHRRRQRPAENRSPRSGLYDADRADVDWQAAGDAAW